MTPANKSAVRLAYAPQKLSDSAGDLICASSDDHNGQRTCFVVCNSKQRGDRMKRLIALAVIVAVVGVALPAVAADASGTWKWTTTFNGQTRDSMLKLKQEGDKLSGVYVGGQSNTETPIEDGKISGDTVSFKVTRERNGQKTTTKYSGAL